MRKLLFLSLIFIGCSSEVTVEEVEVKPRNSEIQQSDSAFGLKPKVKEWIEGDSINVIEY